jgi:ubiquinone/menaquinone biosynthesis C-methylase UbiE
MLQVADFGCGVGAVTRILAEMVGPAGSVVGIDADAAQLEQARNICRGRELANVSFLKADACVTGVI